MAEKGETRDPKSHRTPGQIKRMDRGYNAEPHQVHTRTMQNQARDIMEKKGLVHKGDNKDVDHKHPLRHGGTNAPGNLRAISKSRNRGWADGKV